MKIAMVVGHTQNNQGAFGNAGMGEWDFNDGLMSDMVFKGLFPDNHEIYVLYRSSEINGYTAQMKDLHKRIDAIGCEVSIELHFNSFHNPSANGNEVLYCSKAGKVIADIFDEALDVLPNRDRGVKKVKLNPHPIPDDRGAGFCCRGKSKAIILEPFFGANQKDYVHNGKYRDLLMNAISQGLKGLV